MPQKNVIAIHAACNSATSKGDYSFATNVAKDLANVISKAKEEGSNTAGVDPDGIIIISSDYGVKTLKTMYPSSKEHLNIDGLEIGFATFDTFDAVLYHVVTFIYASPCQWPDDSYVRQIIAPETQFIVLENAHGGGVKSYNFDTHEIIPSDDYDKYYKTYCFNQPTIQLFPPNNVLMVNAGLGENRIGLATITPIDALAALREEDRRIFPSVDYGFMYLKVSRPEIDFYVIAQYMVLTELSQYVLVGNFKEQEVTDGINRAYLTEASPTIPNIRCHTSMPYHVMRRISAGAKTTLVVTTGIGSTIEAMYDEKLPFYQYMSVNEKFQNSYLQALEEKTAGYESSVASSILRLGTLLFAVKPLSKEDLQEIKNLLSSKATVDSLIVTNKMILQEANGSLAPKLLSFMTAADIRKSKEPEQKTTPLAESLCRTLKVSTIPEALGRVASYGHLFAIKVLIQAVHVDTICSGSGDTALHIAVDRWDINAVRLLLLHGASVKIRNHSGKTPLDVAIGDLPCLAERPLSKLLKKHERIEDGMTLSCAEELEKKEEEERQRKLDEQFAPVISQKNAPMSNNLMKPLCGILLTIALTTLVFGICGFVGLAMALTIQLTAISFMATTTAVILGGFFAKNTSKSLLAEKNEKLVDTRLSI